MAKKKVKGESILKKPYYEGGDSALKQFIATNLQYPKAALKAKVEGTVHLRYDINQSGNVIKAKAMTKLGYGLEEEAIRLVKSLKFRAPKNRNVKLIFHKTIGIHFRLPNPVPIKQQQSISYSYIVVAEEEKVEKQEKKTTYNYTVNF